MYSAYFHHLCYIVTKLIVDKFWTESQTTLPIYYIIITFLPSWPTTSIPYWHSQSRQSKICNVFESTITNCYAILLHTLFFYVCPHHCLYQIPRHSMKLRKSWLFLPLQPTSKIPHRTKNYPSSVTVLAEIFKGELPILRSCLSVHNNHATDRTAKQGSNRWLPQILARGMLSPKACSTS